MKTFILSLLLCASALAQTNQPNWKVTAWPNTNAVYFDAPPVTITLPPATPQCTLTLYSNDLAGGWGFSAQMLLTNPPSKFTLTWGPTTAARVVTVNQRILTSSNLVNWTDAGVASLTLTNPPGTYFTPGPTSIVK